MNLTLQPAQARSLQTRRPGPQPFLERNGRRVRVRGIVTDICREDAHYGTGYKLMRSIFQGYPYQLRKAGRNEYGSSYSLTILRLEPADPEDRSRPVDVICSADVGRVSHGDEVRLELEQSAGSYHLVRGRNLVTGGYLRRDPTTIPAWVIRLLAAVLAVLAIRLGSALLGAVADGSLAAFLAEGVAVLAAGLLHLLGSLLSACSGLIALGIGLWILMKSFRR